MIKGGSRADLRNKQMVKASLFDPSSFQGNFQNTVATKNTNCHSWLELPLVLNHRDT